MKRSCACVAVSVLLPVVALAQQQPPAEKEPRLEEVVVTAQKREERLQDVALSLSVIDGAVLEDAGVSQVDDIVLLTPGVDFTQTLGRQNTDPLIRGVAPQFLSHPTVVVFTDGFTLGFTRLVNNALLSDLERIEVLKGPQATLYGRNALGGVINYVTRKPSSEGSGSVSAEYGSYDSYQVGASITGPIAGDSLLGRLTLGTRSTSGFLDNRFDGAQDVNGERDYNARASLRWLPSDALEFDLAATYGEGEDECGDCSHISPAYNAMNPSRFAEIAAGNLDFNDIDRTTNMSFLGGYDREDLTVTLNGTYSGPGFTVTSITGYGYIDATLNGDSNGPSVGTFVPGVSGYTVPIEIDGWSEELRLASNGEGRLTWLLGAYGYESTSKSALQFGPVFISRSETDTSNYAAFVNAEYALSQVFSVAAGLRYDYEKQEFLNLRNGILTTRSATELLPKISVSYKPNEQLHWYVLASRGYHSGGFNAANAPNPQFDAEFVWNYEVGLKGSFRDRRLQTQVTAFYIDWDNQQIRQLLNIPGSAGVSYVNNAGASRIQGFEAALQWSVNDRFSLNTGVALMDSELKSFQDAITAPRFGIDPEFGGNDLPFAPNVSATVSGQYVAPLGSAAGWKTRLRADVRYMGERYFEPSNLLRADAYWVTNVYAGVQNDRYEIGLFADNLFDEEYLTGGTLPDLVFPPEVTIGDPVMYGIRFSARF